ncbi:MAG: hypothetical protein R3C13_00925 [Hyphomonas sp.]|uniref:hypothetical protein n=1 Tax=Hyphomonas sp. TaxID=87 RepID=UPI003527AAD0
MNEIARHVLRWIEGAIDAAPEGHVPLLFLSGPQGAGKSTAVAEAIAALALPVAGASIDDFYLTHLERDMLARKVSPLFLTRGPPGTHDLALLHDTVETLRMADAGASTLLPVFDKLADDRRPEPAWRSFHGKPAAIVIEGWLMGVEADPDAAASAPLNAVEASDLGGDWRRAQEEALGTDYAALWSMADGFLHIVAPGFDCVRGWRLQQEQALWEARGEAMPEARRGWVDEFIQHYERLTRRMIAGRRRPGAEIHIDAERRVIRTSGC